MLAVCSWAAAAPRIVGINVLLKTAPSVSVLSALGAYGKVRDVVPAINAVTMQVDAASLPVIRALPYVAAANEDAERKGGPVKTMTAAGEPLNGMSTWNLDAVNVTDFQAGRTIPYNGSGVYVAVLDTGLLTTWPEYFPQERIDTEHAVAFGGGGGEVGNVSSQPNKWQQDQDSHGTHVTSTILGYYLYGTPVNGVAPLANVIPVKVLNQNGSGWSSVIARGITYVADLKAGALRAFPVVINMSLGGPSLDAMEQAAIDYAIRQGVIIVAAAGNEGEAGMGYPGAYAPVISVAAAGWTGEWLGNPPWWYKNDVPEQFRIAPYYITDFSSRQKPGQDLDVAAPGSWVVGPYQTNGQVSYYYLGGTSMASPHVAGIVALMLQKNPSLRAAQVESILQGSALALPPSCVNVPQPSGAPVNTCWGRDAAGAGLVTANAALAKTR